MENYSVSEKKKVLSFFIIWMKIENIVGSKISQEQTDKIRNEKNDFILLFSFIAQQGKYSQ
jgi:hypothetical protein